MITASSSHLKTILPESSSDPCLPNGPITQLGPYFTRNPCKIILLQSFQQNPCGVLRISKPAAIPILFLTESAHFHAPKGPILTSCHRGRCSRLHLTVRICAFGRGTYFRVDQPVHIHLILLLLTLSQVQCVHCADCVHIGLDCLLFGADSARKCASVYSSSSSSHPPPSSRPHLSVSFGASCIVLARRGYFR